MEDKYLAVLMEKIVLLEDVFIFKPLHIIKGEKVEDDLFIDEYENAYYNFALSHIGLTEITEFFAYPVTISELMESYSVDDEKECIRNYLDEIMSSIYIGTYEDGDMELNITEMPIKNFLTDEEKFNVEDMESLIGKYNVILSETAINNILKMKKIEEVKCFFNDVIVASEQVKEDSLVQTDLEEDTKTEISTNSEELLPFDINAMYDYVTTKVINQDEAVKKIIMAFAFNYLSASANSKIFQPTRLLITGPTGVGKTMILESILEFLEQEATIQIPMVKVPTSQLTIAGYVGMDLEDILEELVSKVKNCKSTEERITYAEKRGVVFFDEIDKKGSSSNGDVSGRGVLNSLLQFLDGSDYEISVNRAPFYFNTKYLNIFASGAFTHVNDDIKKTSIGFGSTTKENHDKLVIDDYIKKGLMPSEFMGRFHQIVALNPLKEKDLQQILTSSINSPILIEQAKLALLGVNISWDDSYIEEVAKRACQLNLGARSLKTIIEESLFDLKWQCLTFKNNTSIEVTKETVEDPKKYLKKL